MKLSVCSKPCARASHCPARPAPPSPAQLSQPSTTQSPYPALPLMVSLSYVWRARASMRFVMWPQNKNPHARRRRCCNSHARSRRRCVTIVISIVIAVGCVTLSPFLLLLEPSVCVSGRASTSCAVLRAHPPLCARRRSLWWRRRR